MKKRKASLSERNLNLAFVEWLLTGGCFTCPEKDPDVLQFDHTRGVRCLPRRGARGSGVETAEGGWRGMKPFALSNPWSVVEAELLKCDILCANCHARKTAARRREAAATRNLVKHAKGID